MTTLTNATLTLTSKHPFLARMDERHRDMFLHGAKEQEFAPGEIIFREGDPANALYLIETGEVVLEAYSAGSCRIPIQTLGAGEVLGWSWLFPPFAWHFQARATRPTRVICCDGAHMLVQAEEDPTLGYDVMRHIAQVLIQRLQATRKQLAKSEAALTRALAT